MSADRPPDGRQHSNHTMWAGEMDAVTQQIMANALASAADEMATTVFRTAHSSVVRDALDFATALTDANGNLVAQAVTVPLHLGSVPSAMKSLLADFGEEFAPGDIFVMNDPFDGGMHTPDIFVFKPVFYEERHIGFATTSAHHADVGGRHSGTVATENTDIFQEGLRLPWIRLYDRGHPVKDIFRVIERNVRVPRVTLGDLRAQISACRAGEAALLELAGRYGPDGLASGMTGLLDYTETLVRQELSQWPDGQATFVDYLDSDGISERDVRIEVTVTVQGDEVTADFSHCEGMVKGALNATRSFTQAAVYHAVRCAMERSIPYTAGAFRPINVITVPGTVAHVVMPGACSARGVTGFRLIDAVNGALAQIIPSRVAAAGEGGNTLAIFGTEWLGEHHVFFELPVGTWGATEASDGNDGLANLASTAANIPIEVAEADFPILIERYGLVPDTGGPGRHRGGLAVERTWLSRAASMSLSIRSDRRRHRPYGLGGGEGGFLSVNILRRSDGSEEILPPMVTLTMGDGDSFYHRLPSGGGFGDPFERDPRAVLLDVLEEKVTIEHARSAYGVAIAKDSVDWDETRELRSNRGSEGLESVEG